jgi:hypothetical protein
MAAVHGVEPGLWKSGHLWPRKVEFHEKRITARLLEEKMPT